MMIALEVGLVLSLGLVVYAYAGYPAILAAMAFVRTRPIRKADITPSVTFIITAYNEDKRIGEKLRNTLAIDYPKERFEVLVASDFSTDKTDEIVSSYQDRGIRLVRASERKGKEAAQKLAVQVAGGEILVFSDVATILPENAVRNIVKNFHDETVGCVSSVDRFINQDGRVSGEGAYVKYEMFLRSMETRVNSLVGLSGSFFAARSTVCKQGWSENLQSDFNTVLNSVRAGLRGVADGDSPGYYKNIADERKEFDRKVRTVLRGISVFMKSLGLVNPMRYPLFAWQLLSHKLCRWLVPFAMLIALMTNALLTAAFGRYGLLLVLQTVFYAVALSGLCWRSLLRLPAVKLPAFFVLVNASIFKAWVRYWSGERLVVWEPSKR
ncbi:MAG: glycosyltransferase family 2 protein [Nitrospira sp.]